MGVRVREIEERWGEGLERWVGKRTRKRDREREIEIKRERGSEGLR